MKIRQARKDDTAGICRLIQGIMKSEFGPGEQKAYPIDDVKSLPESYGGKKDVFYVMEDGPHKIIAACGVKEEDNGIGLLQRIYVDPRYRRKGIGEKIIRRAIQFCRDHGYRVLTVRTTSTMHAALALLLKLGFQDRASIDLGSVRILKLSYDCHPHHKSH